MKVINSLLAKYRQPILFCLIGGINTLVDWAAYSLILILSGTRGGFALLAAQTAGFTAGVANSFAMNRWFTFRRESKGGRTGKQLVKFLLVNALTLSMSYGALLLLTQIAGINEFAAKVPLVPLTLCVNYFGYKLFVFKGKSP
jgi:putative flippase GtrA